MALAGPGASDVAWSGDQPEAVEHLDGAGDLLHGFEVGEFHHVERPDDDDVLPVKPVDPLGREFGVADPLVEFPQRFSDGSGLHVRREVSPQHF